MTKIEKRASLEGVEVRAVADGQRMLAGYAAVFDSPADIGGWFIEKISQGAFSDAVNADVRALYDHKSAYVLGRTTAKTLRLSEDSRGLRFEIDLPDTQTGRDVATSVERGDISGMSFNFRAIKETWDESVNPPVRTLLKLEIDEISVVAFPAYADTEVGLRALQEWRTANPPEEVEPAPEITNPAATPATRKAANTRARLSKLLDIRVRKHGN